MGFMDFFRRKPAAAQSPQRRRFQGAMIDRTTSSWLTTSEDINKELRADLDGLRQRSRDLARNNDLGRRFVKLVGRNIVGSSGIILQARVTNPDNTPDTLANRAIEAGWHAWGKRGSAEVTGRMSWVDLCRAVAQTVSEDGEALVAIIRGKAAGNPEGLAFQLLDTGRLDTRKHREPGKNQNAILMGVEIDAQSRPVAYWLRPNAQSVASVSTPAKDILHIYDAERPEQVRGVPWMHASMLAIHDLGEFTRSALLNARRSADVLGYIITPDGTADGLADDTEGGIPLKINAPGTYDVLPDGSDIRTPEFAYPNTIFEPFTKAIMRRVASGMDVAAHNLTGDMTDVNYSSARIAELEERDGWIQRQNWFISAFVEPVYQEWFRRAMTAGTLKNPNGSPLPVGKADKFMAHEWQARRWAWVDPRKDIEAARLEVKSGIASPQMIAARNGVDIEDVLDSIAAFEAMVASKKLNMIDYDITPNTAPQEPTE
jgi:lambda family phage portal protein